MQTQASMAVPRNVPYDVSVIDIDSINLKLTDAIAHK